MTLKSWADNDWLRPHKSSRQEISDLLSIVDRDIKDATETEGVSTDWRFNIAYNAALTLCMILLHVSGYRASRMLNHYRSIMAMPLIFGDERNTDADYLDSCRKRRNIVEYERAGGVTDKDAEELVGFIKSFRTEVITWLSKNHPEMIS